MSARTYLAILTGALSLVIPHTVFGFSNTIMAEGLAPVCGVLGTNCAGGGAVGLSGLILNTIVPAARVGFVAVAVIILLIAAFTMIAESGDEGKVKDSRMVFVYALVGALIVAVSASIVDAISPAGGANGIIAQDGIITNAIIPTAIDFLLALLGVAVVVNIVVQGFRLIASRGEQDQIDRAKKRLIATFFGAILVLLAKQVSNLVFTRDSSGIASEIAGLANYLLTFVGAIAVILLVVAGIMYILSADESLKDRAKTLIKVAIIAIVAILVSYPLVAAFSSINP